MNLTLNTLVWLIFLSLCFPMEPVHAVTHIKGETSYGYTSEPRTVGVAYLDCNNCDQYYWVLVSYRTQLGVKTGSVLPSGPKVTVCGKKLLKISVTLPRVGAYYLKVRACNVAGCSGYASSLDPAIATQSDCTPGAFWFYGDLEPPGEPVFN